MAVGSRPFTDNHTTALERYVQAFERARYAPCDAKVFNTSLNDAAQNGTADQKLGSRAKNRAR